MVSLIFCQNTTCLSSPREYCNILEGSVVNKQGFGKKWRMNNINGQVSTYVLGSVRTSITIKGAGGLLSFPHLSIPYLELAQFVQRCFVKGELLRSPGKYQPVYEYFHQL